MKFPAEIIVSSEEETENLAGKIADELVPGNVIALYGNLGAGKTFLVKSICKKWEIEGVTSPTFAIVNQYSGKFEISHFDFYRIKKVSELYDIGFDEYIISENSITFIEWAEMFPEVLPVHVIKITISYLENSKRKISIEKR